ncbi:MAG: hypothetical protein HDT26_13290 [Subdoligranulum sp.]|nr:hypothetical protein [Subdoligranulum sp.]
MQNSLANSPAKLQAQNPASTAPAAVQDNTDLFHAGRLHLAHLRQLWAFAQHLAVVDATEISFSKMEFSSASIDPFSSLRVRFIQQKSCYTEESAIMMILSYAYMKNIRRKIDFRDRKLFCCALRLLFRCIALTAAAAERP